MNAEGASTDDEPSPPGQDRRHTDRRRQDRRAPMPPPDESWFGAFWNGADGGLRGPGEPDSTGRASEEPSDSRFITRKARRFLAPGGGTFQRTYRLFVGARAALGVALLLALATSNLLGTRAPWPMLAVSLAYAGQALSLWLLPRFRTRRAGDIAPRMSRMQWLSTIVVDVLAFSLLHFLAAGSNLNFVALLVLPVLMAGVLTPRLIALGTAAGVTLMLIGTAWRDALQGGDLGALMAQAGVAGIGFFVITLLAGELAGRLAREELAARGSMELARQQAQLNQLVIEQMGDGLLVVDRRLRVRAANPAARRLLAAEGLARAAPFALEGVPEWRALCDAIAGAFDSGSWPGPGQDVPLAFDSAPNRTLRVRARFTGRRKADVQRAAEEMCVLFLEDLRDVQARSRQEKLAAMGRVSAGIAHEIRNPLAAIAQANALLQEDRLAPDQQRLTRIVADNAERLKRIVDDVLEVAPGGAAHARSIDATAVVAATVTEWARTVQLPLGNASRLSMRLPDAPLGVRFDPEHLRRVLVNLLDNAHRHASGAPAAIVLDLAREEQFASLRVATDGPPIAPDVERYLFEPFFSTRSRGTGLGLYICRELCERYGASMDYRLRSPGEQNRNEFHVTMQLARLPVPSDLRLPT